MASDKNFSESANESTDFQMEIKLNALNDTDIENLLESEKYMVSDPVLMEKSDITQDLCIHTIQQEKSISTSVSKEPVLGKNENLHKEHRAKVRQRFIDEGLDNFQKHNVLELLLFYAIPRADTNELAHRLLNAYHGNLSEVFGADVKSLMKFGGVGESTAVLLSMMPQIFRIYREELIRREGIFGRSAVEQYIANRFTGEPVEKVLICCLDNRWNLLGDEFVSAGSTNFSMVDRRGIIEVCLRYNATAAIIAHNHPRGTALPSRDDLNTTIEVRKALDVIGVRLIDHIIVAREDYISLACSKNYFTLF